MAKKVTIQDVAKAANVSIATVSRVLNNPQAVKNGTRLRVQQAFGEVGYGAAAPSMVLSASAPDETEAQSKPSHTILAILPELRNPFYADVLDGIISKADFRGYETVLYRAKVARYSLEELRELVEAIHACGVLTLGKISTPKDLEELNRYVPVVQCAEFEKECGLPYVSIDDYGAAKSVMQLLLEKGRRRIALLNGPLQYKYAVERERGYFDALQGAGIERDDSLVIHQPVSEFDLALSSASRLLSLPERPDAIFAVSDVMAVASVRAIHRANLQVPEDIAVVGFDDTYIAQMCEPSLTTVRQRGSQMGAYATEILLDMVAGVQVANQQILMDVDLLVREST
ncbi:LacI family DNA-binding transcriptional regulator [uncultured Gemmiger sp.]|uniref:LacI family DNA-binding transcriptional regulator n=1 Tax=uncultured Gemmiger sp. TaxID=1623490 RepID=UPI0025D38D61|nr:LacI family DNA-binding transcriptional regulator [uncultured Gemmiger sp.]